MHDDLKMDNKRHALYRPFDADPYDEGYDDGFEDGYNVCMTEIADLICEKCGVHVSDVLAEISAGHLIMTYQLRDADK